MSFWWNKKQGQGLGPIAGSGMAIIDDELSSSSSNPVKNSAIKNALDNKYDTGDSASTTINDTDYIPISDSGGNKKKALWSTIIDKIKAAVGTDAETVNGVRIRETGGLYGYYNGEDVFVPFKSQADIDAAVSAAKVGNATAADVLSGKTFTNSTTSGLTGSMTDNTAVGKKYVQNGSSDITKPAFRWNSDHYEIAPMEGKWAFDWNNCCCVYGDDKSATPSTSSQTISPNTGHVLHSVTVGAISTQTKSASPSTSSQTISADSGKYMTSVSISAISPQRNLGTSATGSGIDSTGPFVYIPYGWWKEYSGKAGSSYAYMTAAQAVAACPSQTKTVTSSTSAQTVSPDSGKLLSKVTVNALSMSGTFTPSTNAQKSSSACDMGSTNTYRYVNTAVCYNYGYTTADTAHKAKRAQFYNYQNSGDNFTFNLAAGYVWVIISETNSFTITSGTVSGAVTNQVIFLGATRYVYSCYVSSAAKIKVKNSTMLLVLQ